MNYLAVIFDDYGHFFVFISGNTKEEAFKKLAFNLYEISSIEEAKEIIYEILNEEENDEEIIVEELLSEELLQKQLGIKLAGIIDLKNFENIAFEISGDSKVIKI